MSGSWIVLFNVVFRAALVLTQLRIEQTPQALPRQLFGRSLEVYLHFLHTPSWIRAWIQGKIQIEITRVSRREISPNQSTLGQSENTRIPTNAGRNAVVSIPVGYSGSSDCESWLGGPLFWLRFFMGFFTPSRQILGEYIARIRPRPFMYFPIQRLFETIRAKVLNKCNWWPE